MKRYTKPSINRFAVEAATLMAGSNGLNDTGTIGNLKPYGQSGADGGRSKRHVIGYLWGEAWLDEDDEDEEEDELTK